jgi:hypothetical protein
VDGNQRLGRSWGCPAVPAPLSLPIINTIKDGTCLFIYYQEKNYLSSSYWLNTKIHLPQNNAFADELKSASAYNDDVPPGKKRVKFEYIHNGKVDSVKTVLLPE